MAIVKEHMTLEVQEDEKKFKKNISKLKKKNAVRSKVDKQLEVSKEKPERGCVYIGHIPHGFYEEQLTGYFKQFGKVSNVNLCRSKKTGKSKGYAFVEFKDARVAKIAAQTMNNYLMCNRRIVASFVPSDGSVYQRRRKNVAVTEHKFPLKTIRQEANFKKNLNLSPSEHIEMCKRYIAHVKTSLMKLKKLGIDYEFKPVEDENNLYDSCNSNTAAKGKNVNKSLNSKVKNVIVKKKKVIKRKQ